MSKFVREEQVKVGHAVECKGEDQKPDEVTKAGGECAKHIALLSAS